VKPHPRILESLPQLLAAAFVCRRGVALSDGPSLPSGLLFRHFLGERPEQLKTCGLEIDREPASREQFSAFIWDAGCLERHHHPVECGFAALARLTKDASRRLTKPGQRFVLRSPCLIEALTVVSGKETLLSFAQAMAGVEEEVDVSSFLSSELIDRPRWDAWLPKVLDLLRLVSPAGGSQLASELVTRSDEHGRFERVKMIELFLKIVHLPSNRGTSF
jgi:hypothetical protein